MVPSSLPRAPREHAAEAPLERHPSTPPASDTVTPKAKFEQDQGRHLPRRRPEAAHHRATVHMALHEAPRRQTDRHRGEDHRQQCGQAQEALRLIEARCGLPDARCRPIRWIGRAPRRAARPSAECAQRRFIARQLQVIADAAALLDQSGAVEVLGVDHYPRQQAEEIRAAIRLETDHRARHEFELAQTHLVARLERQSGEQPFVEPGLATRRHARCQAVRLIRPGGDAQTAAQRSQAAPP